MEGALSSSPFTLSRSTNQSSSRLRGSEFLDSTSSFAFVPRLSLFTHNHNSHRPSASSSSSLLLVRAGKGRRRFGPGVPQSRAPVLPKIDDDGNPKFVVFVRDKRIPLWFPLNIVSGGSLAKMTVGVMGNEWGKKLAQGALTRDLGKAIYKDERMIRTSAVKSHPVLRSATEFEYGYKIVDMKDQRAAFAPSNVTKIPPEEELKTVADKVKGFFGEGLGGIKDTFSGLKLGGEGASEDTDAK